MEAIFESFEDKLYPIVCNINNYLSSYILVFLLIAVGLWYSFKTHFVQIRCFGAGRKAGEGNEFLSGTDNRNCSAGRNR